MINKAKQRVSINGIDEPKNKGVNKRNPDKAGQGTQDRKKKEIKKAATSKKQQTTGTKHTRKL